MQLVDRRTKDAKNKYKDHKLKTEQAQLDHDEPWFTERRALTLLCVECRYSFQFYMAFVKFIPRQHFPKSHVQCLHPKVLKSSVTFNPPKF